MHDEQTFISYKNITQLELTLELAVIALRSLLAQRPYRCERVDLRQSLAYLTHRLFSVAYIL